MTEGPGDPGAGPFAMPTGQEAEGSPVKRSTITAAVGLADGADTVIHAGTAYPDDHPAVVERPELFVDVDQVDEKPRRGRPRAS